MKYSRATTGLINPQLWTMACWVKLAVDRDAFGCMVGSDNGGSSYNTMGVDGTGRQFGRYEEQSATFTGLPVLTLGTWYYVVNQFVNPSINADLLFHGTTTTLTQVSAAGHAGVASGNTLYIGNDGFTSWINGSFACVRIWTAVLTKTELEAEMVKVDPVRTSNLWAAYSFRNGPQTNDESGNSRTLTQTGTPTLDASGPPVT